MKQNNQIMRHAEQCSSSEAVAHNKSSASRHKTPQTLNQVQGDANGKNGFTLVELAIALMVIGLLIGGVLKGQELIENAKITATIRQMEAYKTAAMIFRSTYNALPGDIKRPNRIPNCNTDDDMICGISGNGNGKLLWNDTTPSNIESYNFFPHLTKAGMIQGPTGGTQDDTNENRQIFLPDIVFSGIDQPFWISYLDYSDAYIPSGHHYHMYGIHCKLSAALDNKMDDGHPLRGDIRDAGGDCVLDDGESNIQYDLTQPYSELELHTGF